MVSTLTMSTPADKLEKNKQPKIGDDMNEAWYQWRKVSKCCLPITCTVVADRTSETNLPAL